MLCRADKSSLGLPGVVGVTAMAQSPPRVCTAQPPHTQHGQHRHEVSLHCPLGMASTDPALFRARTVTPPPPGVLVVAPAGVWAAEESRVNGSVKVPQGKGWHNPVHHTIFCCSAWTGDSALRVAQSCRAQSSLVVMLHLVHPCKWQMRTSIWVSISFASDFHHKKDITEI